MESRGGDYGFAWTPHGTYARDLAHFVNWLGFTPMEAVLAATAGVAKLFMRENEFGKIIPGYYADCILVDGNPLKNIDVLQDHSRLNMIMINGRIHKAHQKEFLTTEERKSRLRAALSSQVPLNGSHTSGSEFTNFVAYKDGQKCDRIGHIDLSTETITPLSMPSGTPLKSLYDVIQCSGDLIKAGDPFDSNKVTLLPPISGRDILAVGKNFVEHAKEFHASGYDSSDIKVQRTFTLTAKHQDVPETNLGNAASHPVIFTKRSTSIIACGKDILLMPKFTQKLDYEGEIGVIIGKSGIAIQEEHAMEYVWGYTIINGTRLVHSQNESSH